MQRKACDQCHARRKRCLTRPASSTCTRCEKASLTCTTSRQQPRVGRPPKEDRGLPGAARASLGLWDCTVSTSKEIPTAPGTATASPESQSQSQSQPQPDDLDPNLEFYRQHDIYMIGSTFASDFHRALEYCHSHSAPLLDDIFHACSSSLSWARFGVLSADQVDVASGAASVEKLRNAVITHTHDAAAVLMLGQALAAFDSLVASTATMSILRYTLSLVRPWYPDILGTRVLESVAISPIFWDTVWCLLHREIPIVKPVLAREGIVDRVAGLCTSLLPILYDLCVVSHSLAKPSISESEVKSQYEALGIIENRIRTWDPEPILSTSSSSPPANTHYTPLETLSMKTQVSMYRTAILLLIHHIRTSSPPHHPKHEYDSEYAPTLAREILTTRANFFALAGPTAKLQNTSFPLILAMLTIPNIPTEGMWESSTRLQNRPACVEKLFAFEKYFWMRREAEEEKSSIFEIVCDEAGPGFVPLM